MASGNSPHIPVRDDWLATRREDILWPELPIIDPHHHRSDFLLDSSSEVLPASSIGLQPQRVELLPHLCIGLEPPGIFLQRRQGRRDAAGAQEIAVRNALCTRRVGCADHATEE